MHPNTLYAWLLKETGMRPRGGPGYFYWVNAKNEVALWAPSIYVNALGQLTPKQWLEEAQLAAKIESLGKK